MTLEFPVYAFAYVLSLGLLVSVGLFMGRTILRRFDQAASQMTRGIQFGVFRRLRRDPVRVQGDLEFHDLFIEIDFWLDYKIGTMSFGSPHRNFIFRTLLSERMRAVRKHAATPLSNGRMNSMPPGEFRGMVMDVVTAAESEYTGKVLERYVAAYGEVVGKKVYDLVVEHPEKGFLRFHRPAVTYTKRLIDKYSTSSVFRSNVERYKTILTAYYATLDTTFVDVEDVYYGFNGDLDTIVESAPAHRRSRIQREDSHP